MATKKTTTKKTTTKKTTAKKNTKQENKSLNKGLDAIFGGDLSDFIEEVETNASQSDIVEIPLSKIKPNPYQPRKQFDEDKIKELSQSIKKHGLLQPIVVKKNKAGGYYIIGGERRYRATKLNGSKTIKAIVVDVSDRQMHELGLIENIQREQLNPIEEARAIEELIDKYGMTQAEAGKVINKSRTYVTNSMRLLSLDKKIINGVLNEEKMENGKPVTYGQVKPLVGLENDVAVKVYDRIINESLTARDVENIARGYKLQEAKGKSTKKAAPKKSSAIEYSEELVRNKLRTKVEITNNKIIISYKGNDQLNRILERMDVLED